MTTSPLTLDSNKREYKMLAILIADASDTTKDMCNRICDTYPRVQLVGGVPMSHVNESFEHDDVIIVYSTPAATPHRYAIRDYDVVFHKVGPETELYIVGMIAAHDAIIAKGDVAADVGVLDTA